MKSVYIDEVCVRYGEATLVSCAFTIHTSLALVGHSGSGKSLILKSLLGMGDRGLEIAVKKRCGFEWIRGESVSLVPQNPFTALSPLTKIKYQLFRSPQRMVEILGWLDLPSDTLNRYPSELSGGQLQRIVVAMALSSNPALLLLDEPTTALDPVSKAGMIEVLRSLQAKLGFLTLLVTHDMGVASQLCDTLCILEKGTIIERGEMGSIMHHPHQVYTKELIEANFTTRSFRV